MVRKIVLEGEPILRKVCKPVKAFDEKLWTLLDDMRDTMRRADGVGLACPQVGILRRCFVVEINGMYIECVNPEIISASGEVVDVEGCLSVPNRRGLVKRPESVTIKAYDRYGNEFVLTAHDYTARALCHENDHLNGVLYIDKLEKEEK